MACPSKEEEEEKQKHSNSSWKQIQLDSFASVFLPACMKQPKTKHAPKQNIVDFFFTRKKQTGLVSFHKPTISISSPLFRSISASSACACTIVVQPDRTFCKKRGRKMVINSFERHKKLSIGHCCDLNIAKYFFLSPWTQKWIQFSIRES